MNVFAQPLRDMSEPATRKVRWAFIALFLIGMGARGYASFETLAIIHPDEHQQFLEQAQRMVYGYGEMFWEQERNVRHPLYPALLAIPLAALESIGVRDPLLQGSLLRWLVSILALLACAFFAGEFQRRGDSIAALLLMSLFSLTPDIIYWHIHPLSETGATIVFLPALVLLDRRPLVAGVLLGLAFGIRFQMGFFIGTTVLFIWARERGRLSRPFLRMCVGLAITLFGIGLSDRIMFGHWYHSPIGYFRANLIEGVGDQWGVEPWYQYALWLGHGGWELIVPLIVLTVIGIYREWPLALLAVGFIVPHMIVLHKEARFMLPASPLVLGLVATGFSTLCRAFDGRCRKALFVLAVAALPTIAVVRLPQIKWNIDPYRTSAHLFHAAGKRPDLIGVAFLGTDRSNCGNYFYLRRNVPLLVVQQANLDALKYDVDIRKATVNYLICPNEYRPDFESLGLTEITSSYGNTLFRLKEPIGGKR